MPSALVRARDLGDTRRLARDHVAVTTSASARPQQLGRRAPSRERARWHRDADSNAAAGGATSRPRAHSRPRPRSLRRSSAALDPAVLVSQAAEIQEVFSLGNMASGPPDPDDECALAPGGPLFVPLARCANRREAKGAAFSLPFAKSNRIQQRVGAFVRAARVGATAARGKK